MRSRQRGLALLHVNSTLHISKSVCTVFDFLLNLLKSIGMTKVSFVLDAVESAYVKMSLSSTNVMINGSLDITLLEVNPIIGSGDFERVDVHLVRPGGPVATIAEHRRRDSKFSLKTATMPNEYKERLNVSSALTVTLSPVTFDDEKTTCYLSLLYYNTTLSSYKTVESKRIELENVYGMKFFTVFNRKSKKTAARII